MNKLETKLSKKWINNLKDQCTITNLKVRCIKIHGDQYQEQGVSDYLICLEGIFIALEFKIHPNLCTNYQSAFLHSICAAKGLAFEICFCKGDLKNNHKELEIISTKPILPVAQSYYWYYQ